MGGNPVETKVEAPKAAEVLAEAAGVPTPARVRNSWATLWQHRKLALLLAGAGLTAAGGGYGYKHLSPTPGKANAQTEPPAVAVKPDESRPATKDPVPDTLPPIQPAKAEPPAFGDTTLPPVKPVSAEGVSDIKLPDIAPPAVSPAKSDTEPPPLVLPPAPGDPGKPPKNGGPTLEAPPAPGVKAPVPEIKLPAGDKKKPAVVEAPDLFKAPEPPPIDPKKVDPTATPAALPAGVTEKKVKPDAPDAPVIRVQGIDPPAVRVPDTPKVEIPAAPKGDVTAPAPAPGKIDDIKVDIPPPPAPGKKDDLLIAPPPVKKDDLVIPPAPTKKDEPPAPVKKDDLPVITPPAIGEKVGEPKRSDPPPPAIDVPVVNPPTPDKKSDVPTIRLPDPGSSPAVKPVTPPVRLDPPPIDNKIGPSPVAQPEKKKDNYDEDWHNFRPGDTYALISREYYKTADYGAALEAYNNTRRRAGDPIVRVPPPWVLEEQFGNLIGKGDKEKPTVRSDRSAPPTAVRPVDGGSVKFEPVAPLASGAGRPAPVPAAPTSQSKDEYRVTAEAGETIREVARKALGNPNDWWKIGRLNPDIDPTRPIPPGTTLKLPR